MLLILIATITTSIHSLYAQTESTTDNLVKLLFPLTPNEIQNTKSEISARQKAASVIPAMSNSLGISRLVVANTKPWFKLSPPNVRLGVGVVSSVIFTDESGNIWPISSYVIGDKQNFTVNWAKKGGIIMLQSKKPFANTNIAVMLSGRSTPITLMIQSTQHEWDYELYVRTPKHRDKDLNNIKQASYLLGLLSGIVPQGAEKLAINPKSSNYKLWRYQGKYLILTSGVLISPSYLQHLEDNTDGQTNIYEIQPTPVIMISNHAGLQKINVKDTRL